jgi:hypothetical protein
MPQASGTPPTDQPSSDSPPRDAPSYRYDPHLGSPRDTYTRIDIKTSRLHHPELAGRFLAYIDGETIVSSAMGRRVRQWRVEPGAPCLILGHWSDGTVHLKWRSGYFTLDGRFPAWVVAEDKTARMAGGGFILAANEPLPLPRGLSPRVTWAALLVLALLALAVLPGAREAVGGALSALLQGGR